MCSKSDFVRKAKLGAPGTIFFINFYLKHCYWCEQVLDEWNYAQDYAHELHPNHEIEFLKVSGECWDMADFFNLESYPTYAAFCVKKDNSGSAWHEDGP
mmetsp:Transcript_24507/g.38007  ORF Transcript_24507/g.38007 Transcript_24507/m.38007 type:complete len:99 (+) Transcript_24507:184-480(+)